MDLLYIVGLSIASSIDNFAVGTSYGLSGIRIGTIANLIIAFICFVLSCAGGYFGAAIVRVIPTGVPSLLGALALLVVGIRVLVLVLRRGDPSQGAEPHAVGVG